MHFHSLDLHARLPLCITKSFQHFGAGLNIQMSPTAVKYERVASGKKHHLFFEPLYGLKAGFYCVVSMMCQCRYAK